MHEAFDRRSDVSGPALSRCFNDSAIRTRKFDMCIVIAIIIFIMLVPYNLKYRVLEHRIYKIPMSQC